MSSGSGIGYRVITQIERPDPKVLSLYDGVESTHVSDAMYRFYGMDGDIRPVAPDMRAVGPAITVRTRPGDNLIVAKAMQIAQPGDVLVIEYRGYATVAGWGDMNSLVAREMKIAGVIIDGGIRDAAGIQRAGLPVFARNLISPQGALKDGPGEVNVPVACGGVPVLPGDVIIADVNGVTVVPRQGAEEVAKKAQAIAADEVEKMRGIENGQLFPENLDETLQRKGCVIL